jgi:hypothetical protein
VIYGDTVLIQWSRQRNILTRNQIPDDCELFLMTVNLMTVNKLADDCELLLELYAAMRSLFLRLSPLLRKMSVESIIKQVNHS